MVLFLLIQCSEVVKDDPTSGKIKDWYEKGIDEINQESYSQALESFRKGLLVGDEVEDEYYVSMSLYEIAFVNFLQNKNKEAIDYLNKILAKFITSQKPRILAENLKNKILSGQSYKNASY